MGDAGRLYVAADVVPVYRSMLPLSTIITPNWFEVETLTSTTLTSPASLRHALTKLHKEYRVSNVAISSIPLTGRPWLAALLPGSIQPPDDRDEEWLLCIASSVDESESESPDTSAVYAQCVPLLPGYFSGVGDLFSALVLAHYDPDPDSPGPLPPLPAAVSQALTKTHAVLCRTSEYAAQLPEAERLPTDDERDAVDPMRKVRRMRGRELRLVQSIDIIRSDSTETKTKIRQLERWDGFWTTNL